MGCCLFYLIFKKDPFDGKDPSEVKQKILDFNLEKMPQIPDFPESRNLLQACFNFED